MSEGSPSMTHSALLTAHGWANERTVVLHSFHAAVISATAARIRANRRWCGGNDRHLFARIQRRSATCRRTHSNTEGFLALAGSSRLP